MVSHKPRTQVFCCIAIVGVAIVYFFGLWVRQVIRGPGHDPHSQYPPPPRGLTGNAALPVYGHTLLFAKLGGDLALKFPKQLREISWLPQYWTRALGDCFSLFIWGQWRIAIKGPERAKQILNTKTPLKDGWPWTPPIALLGKSCLCFLEDEEAEQELKSVLHRPLSHSSVVQYAREFAVHAERTISDIQKGKFRRRHAQRQSEEHSERIEQDDSTTDNDELFLYKVKFDALRSYTFDLIDGPVLATHLWGGDATEQPKKLPSRDLMLRYMDRMKLGLDVIKMTFGPEWMYVWIMNEYGRAINARMHIETVLEQHVEKLAHDLPVKRQRGHGYHDPATQPIPILTWRDNLLRSSEDVFGEASSHTRSMRPRSVSLPNMHDDSQAEQPSSEYVDVFHTEQDLCLPNSPIRQRTSPNLSRCGHLTLPEEKTSSPDCVVDMKEFVDRGVRPCNTMGTEASSSIDSPPSLRPQVLFATPPRAPKAPDKSILERILLQKDDSGSGLSQVVSTEISLMLWMMMDVGNAWTSMALNLLSTDKEACDMVQMELDDIDEEFGDLYSSDALGRMRYLDALIYEAIRLCPPFLGGLKIMTETVELEQDQLHVAKGSHVFFCQPTERNFDIVRALGKRPERLGKSYPSIELFGFLPFQGKEVPLMVLQTKVFLIASLKRFTPCVVHPKSLIQRVRASVRIRSSGTVRTTKSSDGSESGPESMRRSASLDDLEAGFVPNNARSADKMKPMEAMALFTKIPFPEPRRNVHLRPRDEY